LKRKKRSEFSIKKIFSKYFPYIRIALGMIALIAVCFIAFRSLLSSSEAVQGVEASSGDVLGAYDETLTSTVTFSTQNDIELTIPEPSKEEMKEADVRYQEKLRKIEEEKKRKEEEERRAKQQRIDNLSNFLVSMNSPMAPYSELILDSCEKYGTHYCKFNLSIAGVESGFGRVCWEYSAWGQVGVNYPSWEVSIPKASDWLANNYFLKGANTFESLAKTTYHGGTDEQKQVWIGNLYYFYNRIPL
jgi:hypothetical protein